MAPTDPRWLALTPEDVETEYWAYQYAENGVPNEIEDENFDANIAELEQSLSQSSSDTDVVELTANPDDFEEVIDDKRH